MTSRDWNDRQLIARQIDQYLWDEEIVADKMICLSGPRQIGKTTYVKGLLKKNRHGVVPQLG